MNDTDHNTGTDPETLPEERGADERSDLEQVVAARSDAVERGEGGEGGEEPATFTDSGRADGVGGTGGDVKNQDSAQQ
ncbi:hypothetical protein ACT009_05000 [Sphingomonas sp. Tas61C01]|uniref:hypothetical protein n=1 Tax=Sphingomonas sp. Tas61C01 TaxID=3458297 RepID=UPI00403EE3DB